MSSPERSRLPELVKRSIERIAEKAAELEGLGVPERAPAERAEALYALWRDYRRLPVSDVRRGRLSVEIAALLKSPGTANELTSTLGRSVAERERTHPEARGYETVRHGRAVARARLAELQKNVFTHRGEEPDEQTLRELASLTADIADSTRTLEAAESSSPELAARLSFDRLTRYRKELAKGFIWTPSREKYFDDILEHLVVLDQNRPLLLYGETGTGKTRLARAVSERLTDRPPFEVGEEAKTDIRPLLGSPQFNQEKGSFVSYGALGQALTGKESALDDAPRHAGGLFYMDELNGFPPDALRALVKQISGRKPGETLSFAAWRGKSEAIAPGFGFIGSANLPSEKHPDRSALPNELAREFSSLEIDYPPQSAEDPELYEMMLASLMDKNNRLRLPKEELAPAWKKIVSADAVAVHEEVDPDPKEGGALWRFANMVAEIQRSYKGEGTGQSLRTAVLDPGLPLAWLAEYRKSALRSGVSLQNFLVAKLDAWSGQKLYPEEDRNLLATLRDSFDLKAVTNETHPLTTLSPAEIGALSPRVPRTPEAIPSAAPVEFKAHLDDGTEVIYEKKPVAGFAPDTRLKKKTNKVGQIFTYKGLTADNQAVLETLGAIMLVPADEVSRNFEKAELKGEALERELRDRFKENFLGTSEIERAFTLKDGSKLIELSPADREAAYRALEAKLNEPDVKEFLKHLTPEQAKDWILILRVPKLKDGSALTMQALETRLAPDMAAQSQGKLLYNVDWYPTEDFYTKQTPERGLHWQFVTKKLVPSTKGKKHADQTPELEKVARAAHLDPTKTRRRTPVETLYDATAYFRATNTRILEAEYDWSGVRSSGGRLVLVGGAAADGTGVVGVHPSYSGGRLGASLSR